MIHLYKVLKQEKPINSGENQINTCLWQGWGRIDCEEAYRKLGDGNVLDLDWGVIYTCQNCTLRCVH